MPPLPLRSITILVAVCFVTAIGCERTQERPTVRTVDDLLDGARDIDEGDSLPRIESADGSVTLNDRCMVRQAKLNLKLSPVFVNGLPIGFC